MNNGKFDVSIEDAAAGLRKVIVDMVAADPETYSDAMLERPNKAYCEYISNKNTWGGGIELHVLSKHFKVEIVAVDIQNVRLNRFGETENYPRRILLIYDNTHYDPLKMELFDTGAVQTVFSTKNGDVLEQALGIAREAKRSFQFYDKVGDEPFNLIWYIDAVLVCRQAIVRLINFCLKLCLDVHHQCPAMREDR